MRRVWMGALAVVMAFALAAGGAAAAEKKAKVPKDVRSTPTGKVLDETAR